jgi:hypothetical protein
MRRGLSRLLEAPVCSWKSLENASAWANPRPVRMGSGQNGFEKFTGGLVLSHR